MTTTTNRSKGIDYHLRALGFKDRANLRIVASDNRVFDNGAIRSKPDWVIENLVSRVVTVIEYKSRNLTSSGPTPYETYEAIINANVVEYVLSEEREYTVKVNCVLLYGNDQIIHVAKDDLDRYSLNEMALEAPTELMFIGVTPMIRDRVASTHLARLLVDPYFDDPHFDNVCAAQLGRQAHQQIKRLGLTVSSAPSEI